MNFSIDGMRLVTSAWDKTVKLWEPATGKLIAEQSTNSRLRGAAMDPKGRFVATAGVPLGDDESLCNIHVWNVRDMTLIKELCVPEMNGRAVAFSHNGALIAGAGGHGVTIWSTNNWEIQNFRNFQDSSIRALRFHPAKNELLVGSECGLTQWNFDSNTTIQPVGPPPSKIYWADYSPDGERVAYYYQGDTIEVQELSEPFQSQHAVTLSGVTDYLVCTAAFNPTGSQLAVAGTNRTILIFQDGSIRPALALHGHHASVSNLIWDRHDRLFSLSFMGTLIAWNADKSEAWRLKVAPDLTLSRFHVMANIPDRNQIAVGTSTQGILMVDAVTGEISASDSIKVDSAVTAVACDPQGKWLAWSDADGQLTVMNLKTRSILAQCPLPDSSVNEIAFSPDSSSIAGAGKRKTWLYDVKTNTTPWTRGNDAPVWGITFSRSGQRLILSTGTKSTHSEVIDVNDWAEVAQIPVEKMFDCARNPVDDSLVYYGSNGRVCRFRIGAPKSNGQVFSPTDAMPIKIPYKMQRESRFFSLSTQRGNEKRAMSLANEALELVPHCPEYLLTKAMAAHRLGHHEEALGLLIDLDENTWNTSSRDDFNPPRLTVFRHIFLALTLNAIGKIDEATTHLELARDMVESTFSADSLVNGVFQEACESIDQQSSDFQAAKR